PMPTITGVRSMRAHSPSVRRTGTGGASVKHLDALGRKIATPGSAAPPVDLDAPFRDLPAPRSGEPTTLRRVSDDLELGLQLGYWTAEPRPARDLVELAITAEQLGFDSVWTGESWSSDAFSPLAAIAAATRHVKLCTGIAQISARTPTAMA